MYINIQIEREATSHLLYMHHPTFMRSEKGLAYISIKWSKLFEKRDDGASSVIRQTRYWFSFIFISTSTSLQQLDLLLSKHGIFFPLKISLDLGFEFRTRKSNPFMPLWSIKSFKPLGTKINIILSIYRIHF